MQTTAERAAATTALDSRPLAPPLPVADAAAPAAPAKPVRLTLRDGWLAGLPLWAGVLPLAMVYAVLSLDAGYSWMQTQAMSLLVYAGSAQLAMVTLREEGAAGLAIVLTALVLNLRHVLYGMSLRPFLRVGETPGRPFLAYLVTDEAYGLATRAWLEGRGSARYLTGIGLSLYVAWGGGAALGLVFGSLLPDLQRTGIELLFPLLFLSLLVSLMRSRWHLVVASVGGAVALACSQAGMQGGVTILLATLSGCAVGALLPSRAATAAPVPAPAPAPALTREEEAA